MSNHIWVQTGGEDRRVPVEGLRGEYYAHGTKHLVRDSAYVRRRIADGDLVETAAPDEGEHG